MIHIRNLNEINKMIQAGKILSQCHRGISKLIVPGINTLEINNFAEKFIIDNGAKPAQKGYNGYPFATCASVNDGVCHCYPNKNRLKSGDILTIDMVVELDGWMADSAWSYGVGELNKESHTLLEVTKKSLYIGIEKAILGNRIGDISSAIQNYVEGNGYSVVRDFVGHGIGRKMHEEPQIPHFGIPGRGQRLLEGMVLTIEPMVNVGDYKIKIDKNNWDARTLDGSLSAQFEHTIAITKDGPIIITNQDDFV